MFLKRLSAPSKSLIQSLSFHTPSLTFSQDYLGLVMKSYCKNLFPPGELRNKLVEKIPKRFQDTKISYRNSIINPKDILSLKNVGDKDLLNNHYPTYRQALVQFQIDALQKHVVDEQVKNLVSFNSFFGAPTVAFDATKRLRLSPHINYISLSNMGCVGGMNALVAGSEMTKSLDKNQSNVVAVLDCGSRYWTSYLPPHLKYLATELQKDPQNKELLEKWNHDILVSSLFGDASGTVTLIPQTHKNAENAMFSIVDTMTLSNHQHADKARLMLGYYGPHATLHRDLAKANADQGEMFVNQLLHRNGLCKNDISYWAIHPGGWKLMSLMQEKLKLSDQDMRFMRHAYIHGGNKMGSSIYDILNTISTTHPVKKGQLLFAMGVGPGTIHSGAILRAHKDLGVTKEKKSPRGTHM